ncbi:unnamed protein product, partial [Sphacelaria rigidula]
GVPVDEHAALRAELDAIDDRLHTEIEAALQKGHADRALAISRYQRPTRGATAAAGATSGGGTQPLTYCLAKREEKTYPLERPPPDAESAVVKTTASDAAFMSPSGAAGLAVGENERSSFDEENDVTETGNLVIADTTPTTATVAYESGPLHSVGRATKASSTATEAFRRNGDSAVRELPPVSP